MNMNTLYLTSNNDTSEVHYIFDSYGLNYERVQLPATSLKLEDGNNALYNAIVVEDATLDILQSLKGTIEAYQKKYKVRVVYLNCQPDTSLGFNTVDPNYEYSYVNLTNEGNALAKKLQLNGDKVTFAVPADGLFHYEVTFNNPSITPILKYNHTEAYAAAIVKQQDLESIHFFFESYNAILSYFVGHIWVPWVKYGLVDGYRRLFFSMQVDDFLISNPWDDTPGTEYRTSIKDMQNLAQWQNELVTRMPKGSQYKTELAFNGMYVLNTAKYKTHIANEDYGYVEQPDEYKLPLDDEGDHRYPVNPDATYDDTNWDDKILCEGDKLYEFFKNPVNQDNFYWLTHTFSHQNLDRASFHDVDMEIGLNIKLADDPYWGMYKRDCFSQKSIICPEISGLHNHQCLKAFEKNNVHYAVSDTSRRDLDAANPYFPVVTNQTFANYDGFVIIPRQPTAMWWDCSTPQQNLDLYKKRGGDKDMTWEKYVRYEIDHQVVNFIKMKHDPYMFHEGNLRNEDFEEITINGVKGKYGLLQEWVENMAVEIRKYFEWPLISLKMDDLVQYFILRLEKEQCKPIFTMVVDDSTFKVSEIKVSATQGSCTVPMFAVRDNGFDSSSVNSIEQYGEEPETAWIQVKQTPVSVKFNGDVKWNDDTYSGKTIRSQNGGDRSVSAAPMNFAKFGLLNSLLLCSVLLLIIF
ncbi:hypothetical protein PIROE2DRAFT_19081 [Piromyces sp. E2]|nr:hypothetical protein PIROE2DRAFT_19081 [Piromyces sp. E2]|eukprot:OUM56342.1 hypothetical protein PIROE2DRAFT_19081 [Piromyces sp. E2]